VRDSPLQAHIALHLVEILPQLLQPHPSPVTASNEVLDEKTPVVD
jgi:hypothetical protein